MIDTAYLRSVDTSGRSTSHIRRNTLLFDMQHELWRVLKKVGDQLVGFRRLQRPVAVDNCLALERGPVPSPVVAPLIIVLHEDYIAPLDAVES